MLIDSPRWPRDLDWSSSGVDFRPEQVTGRTIDRELRAVVRELRAGGLPKLALSMFPTPRFDYFVAQIVGPLCKSHLRAFGRELFGIENLVELPLTGGTFTRFMMSGFAAYRALKTLGATCYEGYPELQFRLYNHGDRLPSKTKPAGRADALPKRLEIILKLAGEGGVSGGEQIRSLDSADAAVLALGALRSFTSDAAVSIADPAEGAFLFALDAAQAQLLSPKDD